MDRQLIRDGQPLVLHRPTGPERGTHAGVTLRTPEDPRMSTTAPHDGVYTLAGHRFVIAKGDALPKGASFEGDDAPTKRTASVTVNVTETEQFRDLARQFTEVVQDRDALRSEVEALRAELAGRPVEATLESTDADGQPLPHVTDYPDGAKPIEPIQEDAVSEERSQESAPETKAKPAAPENKAARPAPETKAK